jgi:hypothetical protein
MGIRALYEYPTINSVGRREVACKGRDASTLIHPAPAGHIHGGRGALLMAGEQQNSCVVRSRAASVRVWSGSL